MAKVCCLLYMYSVLSLCYEIGKTSDIRISENISAPLGSNSSELVCSFVKPNTLAEVVFMHFNDSNVIAKFVMILGSWKKNITAEGQYLKGRVILEGVTDLKGSTAQAKMIFTDLQCIDEGKYWCRIKWYVDIEEKYLTSDYTTIRTTELPEKPVEIMYSEDQQENEITTPNPTPTKEVLKTTSKKPTEEVLNTTYIFNDSSTTLSSLSTSQRAENNTGNDEDILQAGDSLTISCTGNVGRPPEPLLVQKVRKDESFLNITALVNGTENMRENCSNIHNSTFSTELTYEDNGAVFRCGVQSRIFEQETYIETDPIDVKFPAHKPTIVEAEGQSDESSVELFCISDGNPPPNYHWYKDNGGLVPYNSSQNITIHNITERQIYVCKVDNTFGGVVYTNETSIVLEAQGSTTTMMSSTDVKTSASIATTKTSTGTTISNKHNDEEKKEDKLPMIIAIVVGGVVLFIVFLVVLIHFKRKKSNDLEQKSHENGASRDNLLNMDTRYSEGPIGADNYNQIDIDKNSGKPSVSPATCPTPDEVRRSNEEYLKKQEEEDKKKKTGTPVEYAVVNKTAKPNEKVKQSNSNEEDHYAESPEGLYDHTHDPRHIKPPETETYDTTQKRASQGLAKGAKTESGKEKHDVGSYEDIKKVAVVGPTTRPPSGQKPANYENTKADNQDNVMKNQCHITNM